MTTANAMFQATSLNRRNDRVQGLFRMLFGLMTLLLIAPVLIILATLIYEGGAREVSCRHCWAPFGS